MNANRSDPARDASGRRESTPWRHLPGGEFRSRGEYFFAQWLNKWRIPFTYEPECYVLPGNVNYVPDFFLTESKIMVEVKPSIFKGELWKFRLFMETVFSLEPEGVGWVVEIVNQQPMALELYADNELDDCWQKSSLEKGGGGFCTCNRCGRPYIVSVSSWQCHHCHFYDGDCTCCAGCYHVPRLLAVSIAEYRRGIK